MIMKQHLLKNTYAAIVALFIAMMALPTTAQAQTKYNLKICGTQVTSDNCGDLSVIDGVEGTVKYDPDSKTLTLQNAKLNAEGYVYRIESNIDGLTIKVSGTNELNAGDVAIFVYAPTTITGGGTLNAKSEGYAAICAYKTDLTIKDCIVNAKGKWGIAGEDGSNEKLLISKATVTAEGWNGSICDFKEITLEDCAITQPAGAVVDNSQGAVVLNGEKVKSEVRIVQTKYALKICDTQVTSDNCGDLSEIDGVKGTVKYDPRSNILTLEGATITSTTTNAIVSHIDGLTIELIGTNSLTTKGNSTLSFTHPLTLTGGGTLNVKSQTDCAVYANGTNLTINNCTVNAESGAYGIAGNDGSTEKLLIKNATVTAEGKRGSICDFKEITLEGCAITQPAGAEFDESKKAVVLNGEKVTSEVKIEPIVTKYDLKICGTQVTSDNCGDLSGIDGVEGTVKYDPDSKTLTLEGAKLNARSCIESDIDGLTIKVSSTNKLNAADAAIAVYAPTTITGGGTLYAESRNNCGIFNDIYLTIKDCIVNAKGYWGIAGQDGSKGTLLISNATVTAEGEKYGSICDFKELTLEYSNITQPSGASFDEAKHAVVLNGEVVTSKIIITRDPAGINTPTIDTTTKQGIYTLSGVKLGGEMKDLPKGVYIVNGKKVVK